MNILITGGAGFIGSNTAEYFINEGHEVYIIDNLSTGKMKNIPFIKPSNFFNLDIRDYEEVKKLIEKYQFEIIVHLAAVVSVVDTVNYPVNSNEVNIEATLKLLEINKNTNKKLTKIIFASSAAVYGNEPSLPKTLESMIRPESPYGIQKYAGEQYLKVYNSLYSIPTVALRFFNVYGPKQDPKSQYSGVLSILKDKFDNNSEFIFYGDGLQTRDFVYVKDVVKAISIVAFNDEANGKIYNVGSGNASTLIDMFEAFKNIYDKSISYKFSDGRVGDVKHSLADISALKTLGYQPEFQVSKGLEEYLNNEMKLK
ncbi:SDR family NAD(P)-dependent oxidoreductase [Staphylococcus sp. EG-SA-13]|nr:SDR family NAD(P)-dependent oxidoreductase [Staphylococcus sp. EG-SA-13]